MQGWRQISRSAARGAAMLGLGASALLVPAAAKAADKVYTVANYPVEAVAENAVAAKQKALAEGQEAALRSLLKRLMPVLAYPRAKQLASIKAVELIEAVKVRAERNSSTEYSATYDFYFRPKSIRDLLRREGIPFTDEQAPPVTLIPVWQTGAASSTADQAAWVNHWKGLDLENSLTPIKIERLKAEMRPDAITAVAAGDAGAMRALAAQYKTAYVLVALAVPDTATGRLAVTLAGRDAVGAFVLRRQYRVDATDPTYARELAAVVALRTLEGRWKAIHARGGSIAVSADTELLIAVEFRGMAEWREISRKLSTTPGVEEFDVAGLSARSARVTLRYPEGGRRLAEELARQGLDLRSAGGNWLLSLR